MRVAVLCEFSGTVRDAFTAKGHSAFSCDLLPSETHGEHYMQDCLSLDFSNVDIVIAHPPCTHLSVSGADCFKFKEKEQEEALAFVRAILAIPVPALCMENPVSIISTRIQKPSQIIQPWMFGHGETKATCLWLKNLPLLKSTDVVPGRLDRIHKLSPSPERWKIRSRTYPGIACAMAEQWG